MLQTVRLTEMLQTPGLLEKTMFKHFKESIFVTIFGFIAAWLWAEHITFFLSILEVTLSFDNAVVNALILEKMTPKWQHRFLTWGILVAVFGMRFLFPVLIVSLFSHLSLIKTIHLALEDVAQYTHYLHIAHAPLVAFGGAFLMMVGLEYFFNENENLWLKRLEGFLAGLKLKHLDILITMLFVLFVQFFMPYDERLDIALAGVIGIFTYVCVKRLCHLLEKIGNKNASKNLVAGAAKGAATGGFMMFIYLELIDASFSLDGVLGSFAISKDIIIITIGLAIGAMFVRSLTLLLVEKKTLQTYVYLSSGAHYAILTLAVVMFISTLVEVPEVITGSLGLIFVGSSFVASLIENKKNKHEMEIS